MKRTVLKMFGRDRKRPLEPEPKLESKQMNLKDFNSRNLNNTIDKNVMDYLDVDHIIFERGDVYDEGE